MLGTVSKGWLIQRWSFLLRMEARQLLGPGLPMDYLGYAGSVDSIFHRKSGNITTSSRVFRPYPLGYAKIELRGDGCRSTLSSHISHIDGMRRGFKMFWVDTPRIITGMNDFKSVAVTSCKHNKGISMGLDSDSTADSEDSVTLFVETASPVPATIVWVDGNMAHESVIDVHGNVLPRIPRIVNKECL